MNFFAQESQSLVKNVASEALAFWALDNVVGAGAYLGGSNLIEHWIRMGVMYEVITQVIQMVQNGHSDLSDGDYVTVVDNVFFNSVMWGVLEVTGIATRVLEMSKTLPLPTQVSDPVIHAGLKISILRLREYANRLNIPFVTMATEPVKTFLSRN